MRNGLAAVTLAGAVLGAAGPAGAQPPVELAVNLAYPERLRPDSPDEQYACYAELGAAAPGVVVAAFTDRAAGAVRVLRPGADGGLEVVFDNPESWRLAGRDCLVRLNDLDMDGRPEVFVYFFGNRGSTGWVFHWDGGRLVNLTPTEVNDGRESSLLLGPTVYDLRHEGALRVIAAREIASTAPGVRPGHPAYVYRLGPDGLEVEGAVLSVSGFLAGVAAESNQRFFRLVVDSATPLTVRVINGERDGSLRVTGATISINNQVVLGPDQITADTEFVEAEVPDAFVTNELSAELTGEPDARLIVIVEDATVR